MKWTYLILHWIFTLFFSPLLTSLLFINADNDFSEWVENTTGYLFATFFYYILGFYLIIPFLLIYTLVFMSFKKSYTDTVLIKAILIGISIIGITVNFYVTNNFKNINGEKIYLIHCLTTIVSGCFLKLKYTSNNN